MGAFEVLYRCECCDNESDTVREASVFNGVWYVCENCYSRHVVDPFDEDAEDTTC